MATEQGATALMGIAFLAGACAAVAVRAVRDWWHSRNRMLDPDWDV
ncbi:MULTISPECIES: hypothetical protein [unclassified Chelatococcus]|nr:MULTISPECIES: hypothetical protein [unclassified Chelatococcus]MBS7697839.1 hypothetical protein [Chelatococcus sp. YT9]MBX3559806.1 hypothetical protein [Chelatococcus sp.]